VDGLTVETAIDHVRRGLPVCISGMLILGIDQACDDSLARFLKYGAAHLLITGKRAGVLKITADGIAAGRTSVALDIPDWGDLPWLMAVADPSRDLIMPMKGPFATRGVEDADAACAALDLMRHARLLPAVIAISGAGMIDDLHTVEAADILSFEHNQAQNLKLVARAKVPLMAAAQTEIAAFRSGDGGVEHIALIIGDPPRSAPVLTRLHSECFTGDLLGSLKCDCGPQLQGAIKLIAESGGGVLLYLAQEGRGIGLINKLRAYALQDQGFDTVDANLRLGFEIDERYFAPAAKMLELLGFSSVRLLTNNPEKVAALEKSGVVVAERIAHQFAANPHNAGYLTTKRDRTGHLL
jgi:GTP cyclohydrolase II